MSEFACPTPIKASYRSYDEARAVAMRQPVLWSPVAVYACRCGQWHLTSRRQYGDPERYTSSTTEVRP
jgi:hypothetical protein